jgi:hypothetical protein
VLKTVRLGPQPLLLNLDGVPPMPMSHLSDMGLHLREAPQGLVEFKQGADVMFFVRHARRFFADLSVPIKNGTREGKVHYRIRYNKERKGRTASAGIWPT